MLLAIAAGRRESPAAAEPLGNLSVEASPFGATQQGEPVEMYTLKNRNGVTAKVITYGAIIYSLRYPTEQGISPM